jgi:gamma-D-glutamyl-L-lysine dipeptidyl-peptidase
MKKLILFFTVIVSVLSCRMDKKETAYQIFDSVSKEIKAAYAPDRRDKTYEVSIRESDGKMVVYGSTTEKDAKEELIKKLSDKGISVLDSIVLLPDSALGDKIYALTAHSVANLRYEADYSSEMASQVLMGTPLKILEKRSYWYRVITPEDYTAWVTEGSLKLMNESEMKKWRESDRLIVTNYYTIFREKPSSDAAVVSDGVWGDIVVNHGKGTIAYYGVTLPNGKNAYLLKKDATPFKKWIMTRKPDPENIIKTAKHFLGFPYLWAGTSIKGMDCSGFTKTTFFLNGVILRRDASQQAKTGTDVDISSGIENLQMGDLLFFGRKATENKSERVTHVGIYIGEGLFIHSATYVHINSLLPDSDNYYEGSTRLVRARRMLGNNIDTQGIVSILKHPSYFNNVEPLKK